MTKTIVKYVIAIDEEDAIQSMLEEDTYSEEDAKEELPDWDDGYNIYKVTQTHVVEEMPYVDSKTTN